MIDVKNITRRFGALTAVNDLTFQVGRGEVVGFLGLNGAGKSTTMRMLTGYLPATSGSIHIVGHDVLTESLQVRRSIGYLAEG
ncbi:MAG: ATP-binding cassette domain-containing protein, partial [Planctomycetota bacterium]|nr:ATP-binding cassette domain-containing protein [Planctomycetota bacterium]